MESSDPSGMIPSADGVTQREYDKVLTIPMPIWDGWFGISLRQWPQRHPCDDVLSATCPIFLRAQIDAVLKGRPLTVSELLQVTPICAIEECAKLRIHEHELTEGGMTIGYDIFVNFPTNPQKRAYLLIHEVWHTRQFAALEMEISAQLAVQGWPEAVAFPLALSVWSARGLGSVYHTSLDHNIYTPSPGVPWAGQSFEQQAHIVASCLVYGDKQSCALSPLQQ